MDRVLERPFLSNQDSLPLHPRPRAVHVHPQRRHAGVRNGWAYRERPTGANQALYTVTIPARRSPRPPRSAASTRATGELHTATGLRVGQRKFITHNNVAVTLLTVTNTDAEPTTRTVTVGSPLATISAALGPN